MGSDMMNLEQLATYLQRDPREVSKLASRGHLPGHKVAGQWRYVSRAIDHLESSGFVIREGRSYRLQVKPETIPTS